MHVQLLPSFYSIRIVDEVLERKPVIFAGIKDTVEALVEAEGDEADEIVEKTKRLFSEFNDLLQNARNCLMSKELILHKQLEVSVESVHSKMEK